MAAPNFKNRTLYHGDNLAFLRGMNSESVHLIATDPPFNKGKDFHATPDSLAAGAKFQDRWSWANDVEQTWVDQIADDWPAVHAVIEAARVGYGQDMGAFLCFIGVRLLEMRRILADDGSLYLHIDATAHAYVKTLMDAIFGRSNFRNEVIWKRRYGSFSTVHQSNKYGVSTDTILFYAKSQETPFAPQYTFDDPQYQEYVERTFRHVDDSGRRYRIDNLANPAPRPNLMYEYKGYKPPTNGWAISREKMELWDSEGRLHFPQNPNGRIQRRRFLDELKGKPVQNLWDDIQMIASQSNERTGYPTQKPLALYERIIKASSSEGDVVLDPFCGCATTPIAAERLGRQWVGMDIWDGALSIVKQRMEDNRQLLTDIPVIHYETAPPTRTDSGMEAAPFIQVTEHYAEPDGPRMSRAEMYAYLLAQRGQRCQGCDRVFDDARYLELDHNTPRSDGGLNHITNRVLLCGPCNRAKSNTYTLSGLRALNKRNGWMERD